MARQLASRLPCVTMTPFGSPVLPDVYCKNAGCALVGPGPHDNRRGSGRNASTIGAGSAPMKAAISSGWSLKNSRGRASFKMPCRRSPSERGVSHGLRPGTGTAMHRASASRGTTERTASGSPTEMQTRSPCRTPCSERASAAPAASRPKLPRTRTARDRDRPSAPSRRRALVCRECALRSCSSDRAGHRVRRFRALLGSRLNDRKAGHGPRTPLRVESPPHPPNRLLRGRERARDTARRQPRAQALHRQRKAQDLPRDDVDGTRLRRDHPRSAQPRTPSSRDSVIAAISSRSGSASDPW